MGIRLALRKTAGVIALSRRLKDELPGMYLNIAQACELKASNLGTQEETIRKRIESIKTRLGEKKLSGYTPDERILYHEAESLRVTGEHSRKIRELCDYMSHLYRNLSLSSQTVLESIFTNVEAAAVVTRGAQYHLAIRDGSTKLIENTNRFLDVAGAFVGSLMTDPKLLLPTGSSNGQSRIDTVLEEIKNVKIIDVESQVETEAETKES